MPLPEHYTTVDAIKAETRLTSLASAEANLVAALLLQAYYMVQGACGPFDEDSEDFQAVAALAMRLYVEYLFVVQDPQNLSALAGFIEETRGSYRYRKSDKSVELFTDAQGEVPENVRLLLCRYGTGATSVAIITTDVFSQTEYTLAGQPVGVEKKVFTEMDRHVTAPTPPPLFTVD